MSLDSATGDGIATPRAAGPVQDAPRAWAAKSAWGENLGWFFATKNRAFWTLQIAGWSGLLIMNYLGALAHGKGANFIVYSAMTAVFGFLLTGLVLRPIFRVARRRPPLGVIGIVAVATVSVTVMLTIAKEFAFMRLVKPHYDGEANILLFVSSVHYNIYTILTWTGFYFVINYYIMFRDQSERALTSARLADQAQLKMLRYQLNPHFLFNTLNAISTLVLDDKRDSANTVLTRLSSFLRYSLDSDPLQKTSLRDEIGALTLYLDIEKARFQDRLTIKYDIEDSAQEALIPSLILQPAVENAIKYAIAPSEGGGTISITARVKDNLLCVAVDDDGPGGPTEPDSLIKDCKGVGLANMRGRLKQLYGDTHAFHLRNLSPSGFSVEMEIPFET